MRVAARLMLRPKRSRLPAIGAGCAAVFKIMTGTAHEIDHALAGQAQRMPWTPARLCSWLSVPLKPSLAASASVLAASAASAEVPAAISASQPETGLPASALVLSERSKIVQQRAKSND
jgi:predicted naringenin-chalcone synthase